MQKAADQLAVGAAPAELYGLVIGRTPPSVRCPCGVWYADAAGEAVPVGGCAAPADSDDRLARSRALSRDRKAGGAALPSRVCTAPNEDSSSLKSSSQS
eukprot:7381692-Prymnesium_polylepis.1